MDSEPTPEELPSPTLSKSDGLSRRFLRPTNTHHQQLQLRRGCRWRCWRCRSPCYAPYFLVVALVGFATLVAFFATSPFLELRAAMPTALQGPSQGQLRLPQQQNERQQGATTVQNTMQKHGRPEPELPLARNVSTPNIIWIMADDLGWGEIGLYPATPPKKRRRLATPNLDKFGSEGIHFRHAYAGYTVCAPSRTAFFTGRNSGKFAAHGLSGVAIKPGDDVTTLPQVLKSVGYKTGAFGKVSPLTAPLQLGFDDFIGQIDQALCHNMYPKDIDIGDEELTLALSGNNKNKSRSLCMAHPERYNYTIDVFHDAAMAWLNKHARGKQPFFLYMSYTIPHAGGWDDAPDVGEDGQPVPLSMGYENETWPTTERDHAASVSYMDKKVGQLMKTLLSLGIDNQTLVLFASDNGAHTEGGNPTDGYHDHAFFNSTGGLRGHKRSLFEGGVRSPSMARWPGKIAPRSVSDFQWGFWDVLPTLAALTGARAPQGLDGMSILPTLFGQHQEPHDRIYFTWPGEPGKPSGYSIRSANYKGIVASCSARGEPSAEDQMQLYDLEEDPFETTDLAAKYPKVVTMLKKKVIGQGLSCKCYQC